MEQRARGWPTAKEGDKKEATTTAPGRRLPPAPPCLLGVTPTARSWSSATQRWEKRARRGEIVHDVTEQDGEVGHQDLGQATVELKADC
nr:unnamed protein product [Digitaria exilis]